MDSGDHDLLALSGLQHLVFCERQCALIHVERVWQENQSTAEGRVLHARVDEGYKEYRRGLKQFAGVSVRSERLGLFGRLDVLEVIKVADEPDNASFLGLRGHWDLHPVEFKRGRPKGHAADRVQVCAQAMCLEEMTGACIQRGSLFYAQIRRRTEVIFDAPLRSQTTAAAQRFREMVQRGELPAPVLKPHCKSCSLLDVCQPKARKNALDTYRRELFE